MKKLILILMALAMFACAPINEYERPTQTEIEQEPLRFSNDPLLDSVYRAQYLEMLRRCGSGKDRCRDD